MDLLLSAYEDESDEEQEQELHPTARAKEEAHSEEAAIVKEETPQATQGADHEEEDEDDAQCQTQATKKDVKLPPLPTDVFGDVDSPQPTPRDESNKHQGRQRTFPHVEGNYPTFVYIPVRFAEQHNSSELMANYSRLLEEVSQGHEVLPLASSTAIGARAAPTATATAIAEQKPHISLSRTVALRQHQIEPFIDLLRSGLKEEHGFDATIDSYKFFTNDEHTRSFISLCVGSGKSRICELIAKVDHALQQFRLPVYYKDPQPHITVAWTLGDVLPRLESANKDVSGPLRGAPCEFVADRVECSCGKWTFAFPLV